MIAILWQAILKSLDRCQTYLTTTVRSPLIADQRWLCNDSVGMDIWRSWFLDGRWQILWRAQFWTFQNCGLAAHCAAMAGEYDGAANNPWDNLEMACQMMITGRLCFLTGMALGVKIVNTWFCLERPRAQQGDLMLPLGHGNCCSVLHTTIWLSGQLVKEWCLPIGRS